MRSLKTRRHRGTLRTKETMEALFCLLWPLNHRVLWGFWSDMLQHSLVYFLHFLLCKFCCFLLLFFAHFFLFRDFFCDQFSFRDFLPTSFSNRAGLRKVLRSSWRESRRVFLLVCFVFVFHKQQMLSCYTTVLACERQHHPMTVTKQSFSTLCSRSFSFLPHNSRCMHVQACGN